MAAIGASAAVRDVAGSVTKVPDGSIGGDEVQEIVETSVSVRSWMGELIGLTARALAQASAEH
eukprot:2555868-Pleurochrysis_carterae.AAC.1